jgi:hypothetical protein
VSTQRTDTTNGTHNAGLDKTLMCAWIEIFDPARKLFFGPWLKPLVQPGEIFATPQKLAQEVRDFPTLGTEEDIIKEDGTNTCIVCTRITFILLVPIQTAFDLLKNNILRAKAH